MLLFRRFTRIDCWNSRQRFRQVGTENGLDSLQLVDVVADLAHDAQLLITQGQQALVEPVLNRIYLQRKKGNRR